eukprot:s4436_g1.t1
MSTDSQASDRSLISVSRISSHMSCPSEQSSQDSGEFTRAWERPTASTTSSALRPTIANATLWAPGVNAESIGIIGGCQLAAEGSRSSSKLSRVEPENGSGYRVCGLALAKLLQRNFSDQPPAVELLRARGPPKAEGRVNWGPSDSHLQVRVSEKRAP